MNIDLEGTQSVNTQQEEIMIDGGGNRNNANVSQEIKQSLDKSIGYLIYEGPSLLPLIFISQGENLLTEEAVHIILVYPISILFHKELKNCRSS